MIKSGSNTCQRQSVHENRAESEVGPDINHEESESESEGTHGVWGRRGRGVKSVDVVDASQPAAGTYREGEQRGRDRTYRVYIAQIDKSGPHICQTAEDNSSPARKRKAPDPNKEPSLFTRRPSPLFGSPSACANIAL